MKRRLIQYAILRLLLWGGAVSIALFPSVQIVGISSLIHSHFWIFDLANNRGHLRDLFFAVVPASAVSLATAMDYLCAHHHTDSALGALIALILNFLVLISGFVGFLMLPDGTVVSSYNISLYSDAICFGLSVSLVTELWLSTASEKHRELDRRHRVNEGAALTASRGEVERLKLLVEKHPRRPRKETAGT